MTVVFIDAKNAVYRLGWAHRNLTNKTGQPTGAIFGLLNCFVSFRRKYPGAKFVVCWDGDSRDLWRSKIYPEYKLSRRSKPRTEEQKKQTENLYWQMEQLKPLFSLMRIVQPFDPEMEADDLVSILAAKVVDAGGKAVVYSSDKDYLQLVSRGITVLSSTSQPPLGEKVIRAKFRCSVADVIKVRALLGDASDGIPRAMSGVGEIAAAKYIDMGVDPSVIKFNSLPREVRLQLPRLEQHWHNVRRNYRLMRLPDSCEDADIPAVVQQRLTRQVRAVMKKLTTKNERTHADYMRFLEVLTELGLLTALNNRSELWAVQN